MLDFVAQRYGVLPSELMRRGDSLDMVVAQLGQQWIVKKQEEAEARMRGGPKPAPQLSQEQMMDMIKKVRGAEDGSNNN